jgi:WD40 repeat protein
MRLRSTARRAAFLLAALVACLLAAAQGALAVAPTVLWTAPNPSTFQSAVGSVTWSPGGTLVADGTGDRWVRLRRASDGALLRSVIQPRHSDGVVRLLFSNDGRDLAVGNAAGASNYRVYEVDGLTFLGSLQGSLDGRGVVRFTPDAQLAGAGAAGSLSNWTLAKLPVFVRTGSGYDVVTARFTLSPNGALQSATTKGTTKVQRTSDGAVVATVTGASSAFSPDSTRLAVWSSDASVNKVTLYRTSGWSIERTFRSPESLDGGIALRFTPAGDRVVESGYLPYETSQGWQQRGIIRSWTIATGALRTFDQQTGIAVTSGVAFAPGATKMLFGTYEGTTIAAAYP